VGYTGGTQKDPTYHDLGDHTESIQIEYDPSVVGYEHLVNIFWANHHPCRRSSRQYKSAIWYHDEEQHKLSIETRDHVQTKYKDKIVTTIEPAGTFYWAEDYHQKYMLRNARSIFTHFKSLSMEELVNSVAASRINGYVGGNGTLEQLQKEIASFGLNEHLSQLLIDKVAQSGGSGGHCPL